MGTLGEPPPVGDVGCCAAAAGRVGSMRVLGAAVVAAGRRGVSSPGVVSSAGEADSDIPPDSRTPELLISPGVRKVGVPIGCYPDRHRINFS